MEAKNHSHPGQRDGGRQPEARPGAVNQVPQKRVHQSEGKGFLGCGFPGETALANVNEKRSSHSAL